MSRYRLGSTSQQESILLRHCSRGSGRRRKAKATVARLKAREADRRKDWAEKASTDLARRFDVIRVEDREPQPALLA